MSALFHLPTSTQNGVIPPFPFSEELAHRALSPSEISQDTDLSKRHRLGEIEKYICVSRPYFALEDLKLDDHGTLRCSIPVENREHTESTVISAAEAGRHMAILGSCALALINPLDSKHYYLASKASLVRHAIDLNEIKNKSKLRLFAEADTIHLDLENRTGRINAQISTEIGDPVFSLDVSYSVLKAEMFERLFKRNIVLEPPKKNKNPYTAQTHVKYINCDGDTMYGDLGIVTPDQCLGHFDRFPALPIAILSSALGDFGISHLKKLLSLSELSYSVRVSKMSSSKLAFAGSKVLVRSKYLGGYGRCHTFSIQAYDENNNPYGEVEAVFEFTGQSVEMPYHLNEVNSSALALN